MQSIGNIRYSLMPYKDESVRKNKHKEYSRNHYNKNREAVIKQTKDAKAAARKEWYAFKATLKCTQCGFFHIAALDFHHEDPNTKEGNVHDYISNGQFAKAYEEIKKCIVLCANCHRIHHHNEKTLQSQPETLQNLLHSI
jgi:hypothetical protein